MIETLLDEIIRDMMRDEIKAQLSMLETFELRTVIAEKVRNYLDQSRLDIKTADIRLWQR